MDKRQAKIEALNVAWRLCSSCDHGMWDNTKDVAWEDQERILTALDEIAITLHMRVRRLENPPTRRKGDG